MLLNKLQKRLKQEESGFTLIELLIVLVIIGILLAIAVPSYLGFKTRAKKTAAQANVRAAIPAVEAYYADNGTYTAMNLAALKSIDQGISLDTRHRRRHDVHAHGHQGELHSDRQRAWRHDQRHRLLVAPAIRTRKRSSERGAETRPSRFRIEPSRPVSAPMTSSPQSIGRLAPRASGRPGRGTSRGRGDHGRRRRRHRSPRGRSRAPVAALPPRRVPLQPAGTIRRDRQGRRRPWAALAVSGSPRAVANRAPLDPGQRRDGVSVDPVAARASDVRGSESQSTFSHDDLACRPGRPSARSRSAPSHRD